jgi:hypothetical protein
MELSINQFNLLIYFHVTRVCSLRLSSSVYKQQNIYFTNLLDAVDTLLTILFSKNSLRKNMVFKYTK